MAASRHVNDCIRGGSDGRLKFASAEADFGILPILNTLFREVLRSPDLNLDENMAKGQLQGWDSLHHVQIILAIEDRFRIKLSVAEIVRLRTIRDIVKVVEEKLSIRSPASSRS